MDLSRYDTADLMNAGTFMHLESPDGRKLLTEAGELIGITLLGVDSQKLRALSHKQQNDRLMNMKVRRGGRLTGLTAETAEQDALDFICAAVVSFKNIIVDDVAREPSYASTLFTRFPWIRDQAQAWVSDTENYLGEVARS